MCDISMDSSNLHHHHHHQLQDNHQLVAGSGSSSNPPSLPSPCFSVADNDHAWKTPTFFLNNGNIHATCDEATANSLNNNPLIQEVGFPWPNNHHISINQSSSLQDHHQQLMTDKIKEEPSSSTSSDHHDSCSFAKFTDILSSSTSSSEMLLLKNTLSPTYKNHMLSNNRDLHQPSAFQPSNQYQSPKGISTTFSQIFPSVNISNMSNNNMPSPISSSSTTIDQMANSAQGGFDLFATARLLSGESINHSSPSNNLLELFEGSPRFSVDHDLQQSNDLKLCNIANNLSSFNNNGVVPAESNNIMEQKSTHQMPSKKQRFESRASCPPFKVRKEKLGDRIAALQQLVAPFGKTDTASVLMEAIGYIKFLQNQVETLSVPYMKLASRNKSSNTQRVTDDGYCESDEPKLTDDLRSRGLCLVPLSCMSYIDFASDATNGGIWPPSNFNPAAGI